MNISKFSKWLTICIILISAIISIYTYTIYYKKWNTLPSEEFINNYYKKISNSDSIKFVSLNEISKQTYLAVLTAHDPHYLVEGSSWKSCAMNIGKKMFNGSLGLNLSRKEQGYGECRNKLPWIAATNLLQGQTSNAMPPRFLDNLVLAWKMETVLKREEILELVLNESYFGRGAYGISNAAKAYFGKPFVRLTVADSALLAGIIEAPASYSPTRNPVRAKERRDIILLQMKSLGMISEIEWRMAVAAALAPVTYSETK